MCSIILARVAQNNGFMLNLIIPSKKFISWRLIPEFWGYPSVSSKKILIESVEMEKDSFECFWEN